MSTINIEVIKNVYDVDLQQNVTTYDVTLEKGYYPLPGGGGGDLSNYYTKDETYSKDEVDEIISEIPVVDTSNLVPYTGANKAVNIGANYFESSKGFKINNGEPDEALMADGSTYTIPSDLIRGTGTTNLLPKFTESRTIGDSIVYDDGTNVAIGAVPLPISEKLEVDGKVLATGFKTPTGTATQSLTANGGVFDLNTKADLIDGKVPTSQLPSYVDDVLEFANLASFPATGEIGKIYIAIDTNLTYRWGGSSYVVMSSSLALGETASTAYRGDYGKAAYEHSQKTTGNPHNTKVEELTDVGSETPSIIDTDVILKKEAVGGIWRKITWANIKATLKAYFDDLYAPKSFNVKVTTPSSYVTGTTSETEVLRIEIPANSISNNSFLNIPILFISKIGTNGAMSIRGKLSTSPTMPSGTTDMIFGYTNLGATNITFGMDRMYIVSDGLIKGFPFNFSAVSSSSGSSSSFSSKPFDRTVTNYLYVSILLANTADQARLEGIQLTNS